MKRVRLLCRAALLASLWPACAPAAIEPVTVGDSGNEPIVVAAPDGTLYISALQYLYRSTDAGASWRQLLGPDIAATVLASDSSIAVDPAGRLFFSFDYPYAGTTAVCTSDDRGDSWSCNPAVAPGGTDRMWVIAPRTDEAYCVTNEGLYQTAFLVSTDGGATWAPTQFANGELSPQTGPLLQGSGGGDVLQPVKRYDPLGAVNLSLYAFKPGTAVTVLSETRATPLPFPNALPSAAFGRDDTLWLVSETPHARGGYELVVARSADAGRSWVTLPPLPGAGAGTATFAWLAAGIAGHVGIIYYYSPVDGDPAAMPADAPWSVMWAESFDADAASPHWTVIKLEDTPHAGTICAAAGCEGDHRFAGDFIWAAFDAQDRAHLTWMNEDETLRPFVRYVNAPIGVPLDTDGGGTTPGQAGGATASGGASAFGLMLPLLLLGMLRRRRRA